MEPRIVHDLHRGLAGDRFCFAYSGAFHDGHTGRLIDLGEAVMEDAGAARNARHRLAYVMVEAYQNIIRHRASLPPDLSAGSGRSFFLLRCGQGFQQVVAVNAVARPEVPPLEEALAGLEGLDQVGLKERFLTKLSQEGMGRRGGAGLGLIEMARRSGNGLRHRMLELDKDHVLFRLEVNFGAAEAPAGGTDPCGFLHALFGREGLVFVHKGPRRAEVNDALVQLVDHDIALLGGRASGIKRALLGVMEVLDRSVHRDAMGLTVMGVQDGRARFAVGLVLPPDRARTFADLVRTVAALDMAGLHARYRGLLLAPAEAAQALELTLVELARVASAPLVCEEREEMGDTFITLMVAV